MFSVILSFILVIIGSLNWLCIGFFQYDFVAGIFGTQANIFSRLIYIIVGLASVWLTYAVIRYRATLQPMGKKMNNDMNKTMDKLHSQSVSLNTEASEELLDNNHSTQHGNRESVSNKRNEKANVRNQKYEAGKYNDESTYYTSYGYDYDNSRKNKRDYDEDDED